MKALKKLKKIQYRRLLLLLVPVAALLLLISPVTRAATGQVGFLSGADSSGEQTDANGDVFEMALPEENTEDITVPGEPTPSADVPDVVAEDSGSSGGPTAEAPVHVVPTAPPVELPEPSDDVSDGVENSPEPVASPSPSPSPSPVSSQTPSPAASPAPTPAPTPDSSDENEIGNFIFN